MDPNYQTIKEEVDFLGGAGWGGWNGAGAGNLFASDGNLWNVQGGNGAAGGFFAYYLRLSTMWWNRWQRYAARVSYITNPLTQSAVEKLVILTMGSGLVLVSENKSKQKQIDEWCEENNFQERWIETFRRYIIDGENFTRVFGSELRFIDPDQVYGTTNKQDGAYADYTGIIWDEDDNEKIKGFMVHKAPGLSQGKFVPKDEIQHIKNSHWGQPRGFSWLLPILSDLYRADRVTHDLLTASEMLSKFALIRQHVAPQQAVETMRAQIGSLDPFTWGVAGSNGGPPFAGNPSNFENTPRGSVHDAAETITYTTPDGLKADGAIEAYEACLRKISSQMLLPHSFFSGKSEDKNSYNGAIVAGSYLGRQIESLQECFKNYALQILNMATGIDIKDVQVMAPEVQLVDRKAEAELTEILLRNKMASRQTLCSVFELDFEKEIEIIKNEEKLYGEVLNNDNDNEDQRNQRDGENGTNTPGESDAERA